MVNGVLTSLHHCTERPSLPHGTMMVAHRCALALVAASVAWTALTFAPSIRAQGAPLDPRWRFVGSQEGGADSMYLDTATVLASGPTTRRAWLRNDSSRPRYVSKEIRIRYDYYLENIEVNCRDRSERILSVIDYRAARAVHQETDSAGSFLATAPQSAREGIVNAVCAARVKAP